MMRRDPMLDITGLSVTLGNTPIVCDVALAVAPGELVALVGPNGAGKTTLIKAAAGLIAYDGHIAIDGNESHAMPPAERARAIAYLPQGHVAHWPLSVRQVAALGRLPYMSWASASPGLYDDAVTQALAATGLQDLAERKIDTLSGGERARAMLARALATQAPLMLADEPIASLDPYHALAILDLLRAQCANGMAVLAVLHDLALAARYADRVIVLDRGRITAQGPPKAALHKDILERVYHIRPVEGDSGLGVVFQRIDPR